MKNNKASMDCLIRTFSYITIILIVIVGLLFIFNNTQENFDILDDMPDFTPSYENSNSVPLPTEPGEDQVENFIISPDNPVFCPIQFTNFANFWTKLPNKLDQDLYVKTCCPDCYKTISSNLCEKRNNLTVEIDFFSQQDVKDLQIYSKKSEVLENIFGHNESKLNNLIGKKVLKIFVNGILYPVQILRTNEELINNENINDELYFEQC